MIFIMRMLLLGYESCLHNSIELYFLDSHLKSTERRKTVKSEDYMEKAIGHVEGLRG